MSAKARRANTRDEPDEALMARYADGDGPAFQDLFLRIHRARDGYDPGKLFTP